MLNALLGLVLGGALLVAAPGAQAQLAPTQPVQKPISIKLGGFFPTSSSGRDAGGNTLVSVGLDYAFAKTAAANPILPSVYFDFQGGNRHGGHSDTYGLGVAVRDYAGSPALGRISPYVGAGIGLYDVDLKRGGTDAENTVNVGAKIFGGVELSNSLFGEVNYQFLPKHNGINPAGVGVQIGYRF